MQAWSILSCSFYTTTLEIPINVASKETWKKSTKRYKIILTLLHDKFIGIPSAGICVLLWGNYDSIK